MITYQKIFVFNPTDYLISEINKNLQLILGNEFQKLVNKVGSINLEIRTFLDFVKVCNNLLVDQKINDDEIKKVFVNVSNNVRNTIREILLWRKIPTDKIYDYFQFEYFIYEKSFVTSKITSIPLNILQNRDVDFLERNYIPQIQKVIWNKDKEGHYKNINSPLKVETNLEIIKSKNVEILDNISAPLKQNTSAPLPKNTFKVDNVGKLQVDDFIAYLNNKISSSVANEIVLYLSNIKQTTRQIMVTELNKYPQFNNLVEVALYIPYKKYKLSKELFELIAKENGVTFHNLDLSYALFKKWNLSRIEEVDLEKEDNLPSYVAHFLKNKYHSAIERTPINYNLTSSKDIRNELFASIHAPIRTRSNVQKSSFSNIEKYSEESVKNIEIDIKRKYSNQQFNIVISDYQNQINKNFLSFKNEYIGKHAIITLLTKDNLFKIVNSNLVVNNIIYNNFNNQYINAMRSIILNLPTGIYSYNYFSIHHKQLLDDYEISNFHLLENSILDLTTNPDYMFESVNESFFIKNIVLVEDWLKEEFTNNKLNSRSDKKKWLADEWEFDDKEIENFLNIYSNIDVEGIVDNSLVDNKFDVDDLYPKSANINVNFDDNNVDRIYKFMKEDKRLFYTTENIKNFALKIDYDINNIKELIRSIVSKDELLSEFNIENETIITMVPEINNFEKWLEFIVGQYFTGYKEINLEELFEKVSKNHPWSININRFIDFVSEYDFNPSGFEYDEYNDSLLIK